MEMIRRSGQRGVPVIIVGDETIVGFDRQRLEQLLGRRGQAQATSAGRPRLGAAIADAATHAGSRGLASGGALVGRVTAGTAAAQAGLQPGDVITGLNSRPVVGTGDVERVLEQSRPGEVLEIEYRRDGQQRRGYARL